MSHVVKVITCEETKSEVPEETRPLYDDDEMPVSYSQLFSFETFPHIAKVFFSGLDAVSLMRCKLVCKKWHRNISQYLEHSPRLRAELLSRWRRGECSYYPVHPAMYGPAPNGLLGVGDDFPDNTYRNVLGIKCDELELFVAVDNGNVEIYDRRSLRLRCVLAGQFPTSPSALDFSADVILVGYTRSFAKFGRTLPSSWHVYARDSKRLLHTFERDGDDVVRVGFDDHLYLTSPGGVYSLGHYGDGARRTRKVFATYDMDRIEAFDLDNGHCKAAGVVRQEATKKLLLRVWSKPAEDFLDGDESADFMTHLVTQFPALETYARSHDEFAEDKCKCLMLQLRYPLCLCFFSNAYGYFEYFEDRGKPYSLFALYNLDRSECIRVLRIDDAWMHRHEVVPYDYDSGVLTARFSKEHLVLGFGSFSYRKDGGIALWSMDELVNHEIAESELSVTTVPAPFYHWTGWDGHTGGVTALHVDRYQLIAVNACVHQVTTRCIEGGDESKKDNLIVYDFWRPGRDCRRRFESGGGGGGVRG